MFAYHDGTYLTRARLAAVIKRALPGEVTLNTHSFRIGGATAACAAGLSDATIKELGRWRSDAYKRYIALPDRFISQAQMSMLAFVP